jgi:hypothetical protein
MKILPATLLLLFATVAQARTSKELKDLCAPAADKKESGSTLLCLGYIEAAAEAITTHPTVFADDWVVLTFKEPYTVGQLRDAFLLFLNEYPAQEHNPALDVLLGGWMMKNVLKSSPQLCDPPPLKGSIGPLFRGLLPHNPYCPKPADSLDSLFGDFLLGEGTGVPAQVDCVASRADPVPVFSDSVELFKVKCGDGISILGDEKQSWLRIASDGEGLVTILETELEANVESAYDSDLMGHVSVSECFPSVEICLLSPCIPIGLSVGGQSPGRSKWSLQGVQR